MSALTMRTPGQALAAIIPEPAEPLPVDLFSTALGNTFERRFEPARLHRVNIAPTGGAYEQRNRS
ncbi:MULTISPECIES: hypothetical protein [unclassified Streptomyces]|uniref:hypothetical protein n=1 Tax=unclassified Streptomyces TaxID=2593676 RepID=UPI0006ADB524|nr:MULTISPECIES: hypothetical protein [unclassified Streptomyces]KOX33019.1 hypothetical protein ADL06_09735 [Streptomyces sp. NRRL F-6491]KOX49519.1 hypothetical protein ADL08_08430 [Streptomyces sp. NRRL F-6492]